MSNGKDSEWWFPLEQLLVPYSESKGESENTNYIQMPVPHIIDIWALGR